MKLEIEWRNIPEFEGCYQVSNDGRVRSLARLNAIGRRINGRVMAINHGKRASEIQLRKDNKSFYRSVNRLVAEAFLPNPSGHPDVMFIDLDRRNLGVENLRWCERSEIVQRSHDHGHYLNLKPRGPYTMRAGR